MWRLFWRIVLKGETSGCEWTSYKKNRVEISRSYYINGRRYKISVTEYKEDV